MKTKKRGVFILSVLLGAVPVTAQAFTLVRVGSQTAKGFSSSDVTFDIDPSCNSARSAVEDAIRDAADVWSRVPTSSVSIGVGSTVTLPGVITNYVGNSANSYAPAGNPIVYCDSSFQSNSGASAASIPGFATGQNLSSSGTIQGCLLVLNIQSGAAANITTLSSSVVNVILAHEIGHCLGLGHSSDGEALMYYQTSTSRKSVLAQDDIDGITYLYPRSGASAFALPGCAAVADDGSAWRGPRPGWAGSIQRWLSGDVLLMLLLFGGWWLMRPAGRRKTSS